MIKKKAKIWRKKQNLLNSYLNDILGGDSSSQIHLEINLGEEGVVQEQYKQQKYGKQTNPSKPPKPQKKQQKITKLVEDLKEKVTFFENNEISNNKQEYIRKQLILITKNQVLFPQLITYLVFKRSQFKVNYTDNLAEQLRKVITKKGYSVKTEENNNINEDDLILQNIFLIEASIKQKNEVAIQFLLCSIKNINSLLEKAEITDYAKMIKYSSNNYSIYQNLKLIYLELQELQPISKKQLQLQQQACHQQESSSDISSNQKNIVPVKTKNIKTIKAERMCDFTIRMFLQKLNEIQFVIPQFLKFMRFTYKEGQKQKIAEMVTLEVKMKTIIDISSMPQIKEMAFDLQIPMLSETVPKHIKTSAINKYPQYYAKSIFIALDEMISIIETNYSKYLFELEQIYKDENFDSLLEQLWKIRRVEISKALENQSNRISSTEHNSNILSIGTKLFKIKLKIENNQQQSITEFIEEQDKQYNEDPNKSSYSRKRVQTPILKLFLYQLAERKEPFPLMITLLSFTTFSFTLRKTKETFKEIAQTQLFIEFMKEHFGYETEYQTPVERAELLLYLRQFQVQMKKEVKKNWSQIILDQLNLIYDNREKIQKEIESAISTRSCQILIRELKKMTEMFELKIQIREVLFKLNDFIFGKSKSETN